MDLLAGSKELKQNKVLEDEIDDVLYDSGGVVVRVTWHHPPSKRNADRFVQAFSF